MMQKALWKLNPFCSCFYIIEVIPVWAGMMKTAPVLRVRYLVSSPFLPFITKKCTSAAQYANFGIDQMPSKYMASIADTDVFNL